MATVITSGATVIEPTAVIEYASSRDGGTIVHPIIGRPAPDATLRPASLRKGRMQLVFAAATAEADSAAAENALAAAAVFTVYSPDRTTVQMSFIIPSDGTLTRTLSATTGVSWTVQFDWVEVAP